MSRWYQHVLTGEKVEVHTLEEDDKYVDVSVWSRIQVPPEAAKPKAKPKTAAKAKV
ncbi:MAG: hypothetical protein ABFE13_12130 [Phycisphaerales bacterium]